MSSNQLTTLSTHPNIEFNLIHLDLWYFDKSFSSTTNQNYDIYWWDDDSSYLKEQEMLKFIKLVNNNFSLGMTICEKVSNVCLFYSFASHHPIKNKKYDYLNNLFNFIELGDYMYNKLYENSKSNKNYYVLPSIKLKCPKFYKTKTNELLKLL